MNKDKFMVIKNHYEELKQVESDIKKLNGNCNLVNIELSNGFNHLYIKLEPKQSEIIREILFNLLENKKEMIEYALSRYDIIEKFGK